MYYVSQFIRQALMPAIGLCLLLTSTGFTQETSPTVAAGDTFAQPRNFQRKPSVTDGGPVFTTSDIKVADREDPQDGSKQEGVVEIDFPGGTLESFVSILRKAPNSGEAAGKTAKAHTPLNIVVTNQAREFRLPEIKIKADVPMALSLLEELGDVDNQVIVQTLSNDGQSVVLVDVHSQDKRVVDAYNTKQLLGAISEEDLLSAIEIGFQMQSQTKTGAFEVQLKLHKETGLLFVRGNVDETNLVSNIISQLYSSVRPETTASSGGMGGPGAAWQRGGRSGGVYGGATDFTVRGSHGMGAVDIDQPISRAPRGGGKFGGGGTGMGLDGAAGMGGGDTSSGPARTPRGGGKFSGGGNAPSGLGGGDSGGSSAGGPPGAPGGGRQP